MNLATALTQPVTFPLRVRAFLKERLSLDRVAEDLRRALATREARFLRIVERLVYGRASSPYRLLLAHAGCTFGDVRDLTTREGLHGALRKLSDAGVYFTAAELKGKEDVVRGTLRFRVNPDDLRMGVRGFESQSSGTNNAPQRGTSSFDWMAEQTTAAGAFVLAHGLQAHRHSVFEPMLPGQAGVMFMVMLARLGIPCARWFAREIPFRNRFERAYFSMLSHELSLVCSSAGPGFGRPEPVGDDGLSMIVRWIEEMWRRGARTTVRTAASNAARIATRAAELGTSLEGATFLASGEPMTSAKRHAIEAAGAAAVVMYGFEPGSVWAGQGCANPVHRDEMHLSLNSLAVINPRERAWGDGTVRPLLYTTLYESAGRLLLNAENGDYAELDERNCGCLMHELGLTLHVHGVGSYEKLTAEGMSYPVDDLIEILERRLPSQFGGGPCDYQLIEEEGIGARTRLTLRVHPRLGEMNETRVLAQFAIELGKADRNKRFMTEAWRMSDTLRLERQAPRTSLRGKQTPVHLAVGKRR